VSPSLPVLLDEEGLVAIDKPAGLPATGKTLDDPGCAQSQLQSQLGRPLWAVHQLDAGTSGVLLFVRRRSLVAAWQARLASGRTHKRYLAICEGAPAWRERKASAPLVYDDEARRVVVDDERGQPARSSFRVRCRASDAALLEVRIATGRTHQVRAHAACLGHPLVGDERYGAVPARFWRPALHAFAVEVADGPRILAPVPADLVRLCAELSLALPPL
jgi:23S rRNA-/tRNA-specific pseudouridylate synthase